MARRKRQQQITYDSKETMTILGLVFLLASITLYISAFIDTSENNFFTQARLLFGQTTLVIGFFLMNLGLSFLNTKWPFSNKVSLIAQFVLVFLVPAFITSMQSSKSLAIISRDTGQAGGSFGYFLAYDLFADSLVFAQYTPLILGLAVLIFLPIAFSMSVATLVEYLQSGADSLIAIGRWFFTYRGGQEEEGEEPAAETQDMTKASRFSDFHRNEEPKPIEKPRELEPIEEKMPKVQPNFAVSSEGGDEATGEGLSFAELKYPNWQLPPVTLLDPYKKAKPSDADKERNAKIIEQTLLSFDIDAKVMDAYIGPSVVQYALDIPLGVKVSKVETLSPNLALALGVDSQAVRIETIPGTTYLGIEVPRSKRDEVKLRELVESSGMLEGTLNLPAAIGKDINGKAIATDVQRMPHLLIAGATGSGKSILTNAFIVSMLMQKSPDELRMILVDPKQVELSDYNGIPHLLVPVITDMGKVVNALEWAVTEMERRYTVLSGAQVRNLEGYNQKMGFSAMPFIIIVIDEMADMMMTGDRVKIESCIVRLAQKARAVGIHLILATQRPSVNVITGLIKANIPARIGMSVTSGVDSRVIIDDVGAESLMGKGDMLYKASDKPKAARLQGGNITQDEVVRIVNFIKSQGQEDYNLGILEVPASAGLAEGEAESMSDDDIFTQAVRVVVNYQKGSSSFLQRKLNIGFNRAARLLEEMEEMGIVGPAQGSKTREVLITDAEEFFNRSKQVSD